MRIIFTKVSDRQHRVRVERADGSIETVTLDSRSFLRHDLAHLAVESELGLTSGVWGSVAGGASLAGGSFDGDEIWLAESISGPMQTMMRLGADTTTILDVLERIAPEIASRELAERLHGRLRSLAGHWASTPYGGEMELWWERPPGATES